MIYRGYNEVKPHYLKMVVWRLINASIFPLLPLRLRHSLLRLFGATIGRDGFVYRSARIYVPWNLSVGDRSVIGPRVEIYDKAQVVIGDFVIISQDSYLCTASHDVTSRSMELVLKPIELKNGVWVAAKSIVLPGVTLEVGAVCGAGSVVTKDVPAWSVVAGNPAKKVKDRILEA